MILYNQIRIMQLNLATNLHINIDQLIFTPPSLHNVIDSGKPNLHFDLYIITTLT